MTNATESATAPTAAAPTTAAPTTAARVGVVGAGTMGRGIAQLFCAAGVATILIDPDATTLQEARGSIAAGLERLQRRAKIDDATERLSLLQTSTQLGGVGSAELVIEAVPESVALKESVLGQISEAVTPECIIASNTSSFRVTQLGTKVPHPDRFVGLHFFNPPPLMRLIELVPGALTSEHTVERARSLAESVGHTVITVADVQGFVVNRCSRPFTLEAQRVVEEQLADPATVDAICRSVGFRMGPFELLDLVGLDVAVDVATSFYTDSFGQPRWRPSRIAAQVAASGALGRKSGRGFYAYDDDAPRPSAPVPGDDVFTGTVSVIGESLVAAQMRDACSRAGVTVVSASEADLVIDGGVRPSRELHVGDRALVTLCVQSLAGRTQPGAVGFFTAGELSGTTVLELTRNSASSEASILAAEQLAARLGLATLWVSDAPGLVSGRIVAQLVNESAFALGEGVAEAEAIDLGMRLGLNYPSGPLAWGDRLGLDIVLGVVDSLRNERGDDRYGVAPVLRNLVLRGLTAFEGSGRP